MKKSIVGACAAMMMCVGSLGICAASRSSNPKNLVDTPESDIAYVNTEPSTRGIYTALSLSINGGDGKVWATVKNDFTLFPATVIVVVELYASDTYHEDYRQMTLISRNTTGDLNIGKTISAEASTEGVQRYWQARMRYKIDNKAWEERVTDSLLCDADGNYINEY